ncbi:hypothetical protein RF683_09725 [Flavobacterium sp. 20NA77.7]|uniref:Uncharacterized protein n=1 Tax=Flavobacterium nakdongensis TaxID=3073563 RepID=A0ABY9RA85_9FLAO|nr:hypothetical protein [Flavobacterium sp. 20NA77.7]WMW77758.1 hypothetical protein RF683_09725 [Flavobacterium sp. 20NA77.7]
MRKVYYILFILLGIIPATFLLIMILISGIFGAALSGKISYLIQMFLGISGYLGLISLLRGLKKKYYKLNLILLGLGFLGFNMFLFFDEEMTNLSRRILSGKGSLEQLSQYVFPNIVILTFVVIISIKMYNEKNEK